MDSLDNFRERVEALEQRTEQLLHHLVPLNDGCAGGEGSPVVWYC